MKAGEQQHWRRAADIFDVVVELAAPERGARLDALCSGDAALRARVDRMLAADAGGTEPFAGDGARWSVELAAPSPQPQPDWRGRRVGAWQIVGILGHGGMGVVHAVERDDDAYRQRAALKLIRIGADSPAARERFLRERQTLAHLQHPNIATLLDGGFTDDGDPYFVMEYVDGQPIDAWCDARRLDLRARTELFAQVLEAVQYAHRNLVVHRDLKPSNILVDNEGRVKLLDFGVAKQLQDTDATTVGERALTLEYASPEQLDAAPITTATDIWQLGIVLYRLLGGAHPFGIDRDTPLPRQLQQLGREPEALPRAAAGAGIEAAAARGHAPATLARALRGDLSAIVHGCLQRVPEHRYASVEALADDLRRWRGHQPLRVVVPGRWRRAGLWLRRNRVLAAAAASVAVAVLGGAGLALWQADVARQQSVNARESLQFLGDTLAAAAPENALSPQVSVRELLDKARAELDKRDTVAAAVRQPVQRMLADLYHSLGEKKLAVELFEAGFAGVEPRNRDEAVALARTLGLYAGALDQMGRGEEGLAMYRRAAAWRSRFAPDDPVEQLRSTVSLGSGYYGVRDYDAAIEHWRRAIEEAGRMSDPPLEPLIQAYQMLGGTLNQQRDHAAALETIGQAFAIADEHAVPPLSSIRLTLMRHEADALTGLGNGAAAEPVIREAIALRARLTGDAGTGMATLHGTLAIVLNDLGRYREALEALAHSDSLHATSADDPLNNAIGLNNTASIHESAGDYPRALELFEQSIAVFEGAGIGPDDASRRQMELNHARCLAYAGHFADADAKMRHLQARALALDGEGSIEYAMTTWQRVALARRMRDARQGLPLLAQARTIWRGLVPDTHQVFAHALRAEADFAEVLGDHAAAAGARREALAQLEANGAMALNVAVTRAELARSLSVLDDRIAARELMGQALPVLREALLPEEVIRAEAEVVAQALGV